jgi:hypothetical protein
MIAATPLLPLFSIPLCPVPGTIAYCTLTPSSITDAADNMFRRKAEENPNEQELCEEHFKISKLLAEQCPPPGERGFTLYHLRKIDS